LISLSSDLAPALLEYVPRLHWRDGRTTAMGAAAAVKDCEIAETLSDAALQGLEGAQLMARLTSELLTSPEFRDRALPFRLSAFRFMRYRKGGSYGLHTDEAINGHGFRADMSFTMMLQPAKVGGLLVVNGQNIHQGVGDVFLYPSTLAHGVTSVLEGERVVIVGWVQSLVRDHARRALLAELHRMAEHPSERQTVALQSVRNELLRQWCG